MSLSGVTSLLPIACSGLMYVGVPTAIPVRVSVSPPATLTARAMPKSATSARPLGEEDVLGLDVAMDDALRVRERQRLGDLLRRCRSHRRSAAASRDRAGRAATPLRRTASCSTACRPPSPSRAPRRCSGGCSVRPTSISRRKRSAPSEAASSGFSTLTATWRSFARSCARYTVAIPPCPELSLEAVLLRELTSKGRQGLRRDRRLGHAEPPKKSRFARRARPRRATPEPCELEYI